jgi:hypothetical protein
MARQPVGRWLLLIHQIPPTPNYLRVKVWRRLQRLGAVSIKASVYALPLDVEDALEDFQWVAREILAAGGEATVCEARFLEGLTDVAVESLFRAARDADYAQLAEEARQLGASADASTLATGVRRLRKRLTEVAELDFFGAAGRESAEGLVSALEQRVARALAQQPARQAKPEPESVRGRTWVTRRGIHVDRMASAWLIKRFIDPEARFRFVPGKSHAPAPGELRFDMFEGEYTHEGEACTFEVLLERFGLKDRALTALAEIVHDIDLKDEKYGRPETAGVERLVAGIALAHREDEERMARASAVLDDLYAIFTKKPAREAARALSTKEDA